MLDVPVCEYMMQALPGLADRSLQALDDLIPIAYAAKEIRHDNLSPYRYRVNDGLRRSDTPQPRSVWGTHSEGKVLRARL